MRTLKIVDITNRIVGSAYFPDFYYIVIIVFSDIERACGSLYKIHKDVLQASIPLQPV
mgnify:FL=1